MNRIGKFITLLALALVLYAGYATWQGTRGFTPPDIDALKKRMEDDFSARKFTVVEISMLRRTPRELAGFVKLKAPGSNEIQQRNCSATMADDKVTTSWTCN